MSFIGRLFGFTRAADEKSPVAVIPLGSINSPRPPQSEVTLSRILFKWSEGLLIARDLEGTHVCQKWKAIPAPVRMYVIAGAKGRDRDAYKRIERIGGIADDRMRLRECRDLIEDIIGSSRPAQQELPLPTTGSGGSGLLSPRTRRRSQHAKETLSRLNADEKHAEG